MALNVVTMARSEGHIPPNVVQARFNPTDYNHKFPLELRPADRPASRTGARPDPFVRTGGRIDLVV
jgi:hypothetical protein